ncbi:MAG: hypothetical protein HXY45_23180 [Syntrophaceae bacterium]|nr:hypothetical protein [Syntrophaceae bacterium]
MEKSSVIRAWAPWLVSIFFLSAMAGCAEVQVRTLPAPPPTAKLRVFVQPITAAGGDSRPWDVPHDRFEKGVRYQTETILSAKGIYEVIGEEELQETLGGKRHLSRSDWSKKNWDLARKVGRALHADYALIVERSRNKAFLYWDLVMIGVEKGGQFQSLVRVPDVRGTDFKGLFNLSYRDLFLKAKDDMLATAMRKGRFSSGESSGVPKESQPEKTAPGVKAVVPLTPENPADMEKLIRRETAEEGRVPIAVYDLSAPEPFKVAALILSEALREEIYRLGGFALVNRENIIQVLNEMGLQQTGLVDERQAVRAGKGLAAHQVVMGQFGVLGKTVVLQAKRIDVQSQANLALASIKCSQGMEEELLAGLPELARRLTGK